MTIRLPKATLEMIDALVRARPTKIPRQTWVLEAIQAKLNKENRVEGTLEVVWENPPEDKRPSYRLLFFRADREGGPVAPLTVMLEEVLERRLAGWGLGKEHARAWIDKLKVEKSVSVPKVMVPASEVGPYGFKTGGLGIRRKLRDGRTAILYPNHWQNTVGEIRNGDKILLLNSGGFPEQEATVTSDQRVFVTVGAHLFPETGPGTVRIREAQTDEREELLSIYREFFPQ